MNSIFYVDGQFVESGAATIPVTDLAVLRGYGVFDFLRTYNGKPFHLEAHVDRLFRSAAEIGMDMRWSREEIIAITQETLARNDHAESNVRIVVTGGDAPDNITPNGAARLAVLVPPAAPPADHYYADGAKVITVTENRYLPQAKSLNYIPAIRALKQAKAQGAVEAIYVDKNGSALEGTTTNIFAFYGDTLVTPSRDILPGITRGVILELVVGVYPVEQRDISLDELHRADEVFITASNKQVMPVVRVDDAIIGAGVPGERTRHVMTLFGQLTGVPLPQKTPVSPNSRHRA
jgi:branched-chain amino acid aminotransferase